MSITGSKSYNSNNIAGTSASNTLQQIQINQINDEIAIATKVSLTTTPQTITGAILMNNIGNVLYGDGSHLTNIANSTLTTTTMPSTGTFYLPYTASATGASGLTPYTNGNVNYNPATTTLTTPKLNVSNNITSNSTAAASRQVYSTTYNLMDDGVSAGGVSRGKLHSTVTQCLLEIDAGNSFSVMVGGTGAFSVDSNTATFINPPTSYTPPTDDRHLANKIYVDNVSSQPIGSIIIYSSNTIPTGWLLCNGQLVSTTTYASLFAVIGYTYTLLIAPTSGNFYLPDFTGLYTRGKGLSTTHPGVQPLGQDAIVTTNTALGEYQMSSPGDHVHFMSAMNTNTQETTGTVTVVTGLTGNPYPTTHAVVSNGVVTTNSTIGTGRTTLYTQNSWAVNNASECRPNNISMNYIIKYGGTITPITAPSFSQVSNVLTVQNNYATSGIINFQLDDASSVLQTPLSLSSTGITATANILLTNANPNISATSTTANLFISSGVGTAMILQSGTTPLITMCSGAINLLQPVTCSGKISTQSSTNNSMLSIISDAGGKNYIQSAVTATAGSITDLIFGSYFNSTSYATFNSQGISLNAGQGSYLFGRNDGATFQINTTTPSANGLYPIGYSFNWVFAGITFVSGTAVNYVTPSIPIGVWQISGGCVITRGTGTFAVTSYTQLIASIATGTGTINTLAMIFPINGYTGIQLVAPMSTITLVATSACTLNMNNTTVCTVGTALRYNNFTFTKIA